MAEKSKFDRAWITSNAVDIISGYADGVLTLRALHYQLVGRGMTNDITHYKKTVTAMIAARWDGSVAFSTFADLDREMVGTTNYEEVDLDDAIENGQDQIRAWMRHYSRNKWENQPCYIEVFIEKKALQGVFKQPCADLGLALGACKGYPSLTFLYEAAQRFSAAFDAGKEPVLLYFGDYDPSGEDIPRSIRDNLSKLGVEVALERVALMEHQAREWNLPHAPVKQQDSRTANWDGFGQIELDAVRPDKIITLLNDAVSGFFDEDLHDQLMKQEKEESVQYVAALKEYVSTL